MLRQKHLLILSVLLHPLAGFKHHLTEDEVQMAVNSLGKFNSILRDIQNPPRSSRSRRLQEMSYVYDTDTNEETGSWNEWVALGPCSRTCDGGVVTEGRSCAGAEGSCAGPTKRYSSCNLQECPPSSTTFREDQCSKYNDVPFERNLYEWIPYLKAPRKCELNCMPKGERFYYRHEKKVCQLFEYDLKTFKKKLL